MMRYCFERYTLTQTTFSSRSYRDDESDYETVEEEVLGYWAIYDRRFGFNYPIAFTKDATDAQKIVTALNQ